LRKTAVDTARQQRNGQPRNAWKRDPGEEVWIQLEEDGVGST